MIRPLNEMILTRALPRDPMRGPIHIPERFVDQANRNQDGVVVEGIVVAIGPGELNLKTGKRMPIPVEVGQRVIYPLCVVDRQMGYVIEEDGQEHHLFHSCHVFGEVGNGVKVHGVKNFKDGPRPGDIIPRS